MGKENIEKITIYTVGFVIGSVVGEINAESSTGVVIAWAAVTQFLGFFLARYCIFPIVLKCCGSQTDE